MNTIRPLAVLCMLLSLIGLGTLAVSAATEDAGPCAADVQKYCSDIQPGGGAIAQCLSAHQADLSDTCKQHADEIRHKMQSFNVACRDDLQKFCSDVPPGNGRKIACLKGHAADLSPSCQTEIGHMHTGAQVHPASTSPSAAPAN